MNREEMERERNILSRLDPAERAQYNRLQGSDAKNKWLRQKEAKLASIPQISPEQQRQNALDKAETERLAKEASLPQLEAYKDISTLEGGGKLTARTLTGADIQKQMEESPWYKMALQKQAAEQSQLLDQAARQQAGAMAGARTQLAMRGGLSGGARERMATAGAGNLAEMMQQQRQAGAIERGQLGMQGADLASRIGQFNVGQQSQADLTNLQAQIANLAAIENRKLQKYGEKIKGYAAEQTSEGIRGGGKK